jgi:sugar lactone lactonase YvrE
MERPAMTAPDVHCIADVGATLGEGPLWDARTAALYWLDIPEQRLFHWREGEGASMTALSQPVCSLVPRARGGFIGGGYAGFLAHDDWQSRAAPAGQSRQ